VYRSVWMFLALAMTGLVALAGFAGVASASSPSAASAGSRTSGDKPLFAVQPNPRPLVSGSEALPTWTFSFTYKGTTYDESILGSDPAGGGTTTIPVYLIPIELIRGSDTTNPEHVLSNGLTVVQNTLNSPVFQSGVDFVQNGTNVGKTQYIDAYQRLSFWGKVSAHPTYHVLWAKPTIEPEQTLTVPAADGKVATSFGVKAIEVSISWFDNEIQSLITSLHVPTSAVAVFITTQTYFLQGNTSGCCIGGYHSYNGTSVYAAFSYIQKPGAFSQDVSGLSHELTETLNDAQTFNNSPCGIYEVADPLEDTANYGDYPYTLGGFTYHLQDLATPVYFGAPASTTLDGLDTFQGTHLSVCQNGS